jgi:hypothetical protein
MSKKKWIISGGVVLAIVAATVVGRQLTGKTSASADSSQSSSDKVTTLQVAHTQNYVPYDFVNDKGKSDGFEVAVLKAVDDKLKNYKFEYTGTSDEDLLIGLESGKDFYNVQTNKRANLYFNTFLYEKSADTILHTLMEASREAVYEVSRQYKERFKIYSERSHIHSQISHDITVMTFSQYLDILEKKGFDSQALIREFFETIGDYDKREVGFDLIDYLEAKTQSDEAKVIVFLAPPFCPHNYTDQLMTSAG